MKAAIGSGRAGYELKTELAKFVKELGDDAVEVGMHGLEPVGFAEAAGKARLDGRAERCVLISGSGIGASAAKRNARCSRRPV